jgi:peptidoglycan/xylan/chitin deacetylase (PgdA/CDA1 family)
MTSQRFRPDRLLTLSLFHPLRHLRNAEWRLPILMYHSISEAPEPRRSAYFQTVTHPRAFREQMSQLASLGWRGIDLPTGCDVLKNRTPGKYVVLTFDDGFRNFYTEAAPCLREQRFTASMFLPTGFISNARRSFNSVECLTWDEVRELRRLGFHFGSHTVTHPRLYGRSWDEIEKEVRESKEELESQLNEPITTFAYPYAYPQADQSFSGKFTETLNRAGYSCAVTTCVGRATYRDDLFLLPRLPANSSDDAALFLAKLEGGYDWVGAAQAAVKRLKTLQAN